MNELEKVLNEKQTENGDVSYKSTGDIYLDILFMSEYFTKHLNEVPAIGTTEYAKLFAMFMRDPRYGIGKRDLGRVLMKNADVSAKDIVKAGRFDDLIKIPTMSNINYLMSQVLMGNQLAKKWMPRLTGKDKELAKAFCRQFQMSEKRYRELIKCSTTTEYKLSYAEKNVVNQTELDRLFDSKGNAKSYIHPLVNEINFEQVPSLAMIKYYNTFNTREDLSERFHEYLEGVKKGEKKLNTKVTNVYDIYKNRDKIDADLFFDQIEKIKISCIPVLDTSGSMYDDNDSIGKAMSIAHYLGKCSTFCPNQVVSFSSKPQLIDICEKVTHRGTWYRGQSSFGENNKYSRELNSMYTGDCSNTDLGKVMELFQDLKEQPDYIVVLSDMEFDYGSSYSKDKLMKLWKEKGYTTKLIWWNFNSRNNTVPETDGYGNIYMSGYSPMLLKYLEAGFDGKQFLDKLINEYKDKVDND